ncbi:MAG: hypothetical protein LQ349_000581 [Xanthoria aureola]|nr:MAG: hypothetical protein LQ339_001547 [Xanthoria mediterranea]KAI4239176.1 MAG: hypothetical protein LQ349_000581 [Xanthoria aureola]
MQIYTILTTLFLASTALACANGPYPVGSACGGDCAGAQRCSKNNNNVIRCDGGFWRVVKHCNHCRFGACT